MILAGEPSPATSVLERRVAEAGLSGRILFVGIRSDIHRLMLGSDLLLFPSRGEGLGMVAVEAQAAGLPVTCIGCSSKRMCSLPRPSSFSASRFRSSPVGTGSAFNA